MESQTVMMQTNVLFASYLFLMTLLQMSTNLSLELRERTGFICDSGSLQILLPKNRLNVGLNESDAEGGLLSFANTIS